MPALPGELNQCPKLMKLEKYSYSLSRLAVSFMRSADSIPVDKELRRATSNLFTELEEQHHSPVST